MDTTRTTTTVGSPWAPALVAIWTLGMSGPAMASFHKMHITEVYTSCSTTADVQFIELEMQDAGQHKVAGTLIRVYGSDASTLFDEVFPTDVSRGERHTKIFIATPAAQAFFGVSADLVLESGRLPTGGGKVCFHGDGENIDCFSWGTYQGTDFGVPFAAMEADFSAQRVADSGNNRNDFTYAVPTVENNVGDTGSLCGNGVVEGTEACDDGNLDNGDTCLIGCVLARCGDGYLQRGAEQCDDGAQNDDATADACRTNCLLFRCGDGFIDSAEVCDDGNDLDTDACDNGCEPASGPFCGDGRRDPQEACDDGNNDHTDACAGCGEASCGDGFVWAGVETCDDGNQLEGDGCSADCMLEGTESANASGVTPTPPGLVGWSGCNSSGKTNLNLLVVILAWRVRRRRRS